MDKVSENYYADDNYSEHFIATARQCIPRNLTRTHRWLCQGFSLGMGVEPPVSQRMWYIKSHVSQVAPNLWMKLKDNWDTAFMNNIYDPLTLLEMVKQPHQSMRTFTSVVSDQQNWVSIYRKPRNSDAEATNDGFSILEPLTPWVDCGH